MDRDQVLIDSYEGDHGLFFSSPAPKFTKIVSPPVPSPVPSSRCFEPFPKREFATDPAPPGGAPAEMCLSVQDRALLYIAIILLVWIGALLVRTLGKIKKMKGRIKEIKHSLRSPGPPMRREI